MKILLIIRKSFTRVLVLVLAILLFTEVSYGQSQIFNSSGTYNVPAGVTTLVVEAWGGGGAGGGSTNAGTLTGRGGGGGGRRSIRECNLNSCSGNDYINIIVAGQKIGTSGATGNNGDRSTITGFENAIFAAGGSGGTGNTTGGSPQEERADRLLLQLAAPVLQVQAVGTGAQGWYQLPVLVAMALIPEVQEAGLIKCTVQPQGITAQPPEAAAADRGRRKTEAIRPAVQELQVG